MNFIFSKHALEQMKLRNISNDVVEDILKNPGQIMQEDGRKIYQSIITSKEEETYLIRIFVTANELPHKIITVYKTSKIKKYYESKI
ncbi:MAG: DUF4258 domain-containing protein [Bacteroidia bacterium]